MTTTKRSRGAHPEGVVVHHPIDLVGLTPVRREGVPVANPRRTLVDLGASYSGAAVEAALETLVVSRLVTVAGARAALARHARPGRSGAGVLRRVLDDWALADSVPDSEVVP
ncbi:MAG: hypothetical protein GEV08_07170 [Acidimicrobiia bacterium]|nr:hypothetical protein [Acidimicrobiia bacterium]